MQIGLNLNLTKSVLRPVHSIYLRSIWGSQGVVMAPAVKKMCHIIVRYIGNAPIALKPLHKIRGYINYYFSFASYFNSVINKFLCINHRSKFLHIKKCLINKDAISLNKLVFTSVVRYWSNVTMIQMAFTEYLWVCSFAKCFVNLNQWVECSNVYVEVFCQIFCRQSPNLL